jgi:hypothetical protein
MDMNRPMMSPDLPLPETIALQPAPAETEWLNPVPAWILSTLLHAAILFAIAFIQIPDARRKFTQIIRLVPAERSEETPIGEFDFRMLDVGEESVGGDLNVKFELPARPLVAQLASIDLPDGPEPTVTGFETQNSLQLATGKDFFRRYKTKGLVGVGSDSTSVAIDRLTREILLSLEERPTLVVWILDQSASLIPQRKEIYGRLDRIYREIGTVQASGTLGRLEDQPLLSSVVAFGQRVSIRLPKPTDDVERLQQAVAQIERDDSGIENVFRAVTMAANQFRKFRRTDRNTGAPIRNVIFIVFTDEAGDDQENLESAIEDTRRIEIPVFVVGVPAPFGQQESRVKWVDPDPAYDQTPGWGLVSQGPESVLAERIRLGSETDPEKQTPIDSGFGPSALTRLCYETGGIYFAVHPDRNRSRSARPHQVSPFSSHIRQFFDPEVMRRYRPDYVSLADYQKLIQNNDARSALVRAAQESWIGPMDEPRRRFVVQSEAQFAEELTEAQKSAAVLEPRLNRLYGILEKGEADRPVEDVPRWQAGYDLAVGRTLATLVRTRTYNAMLAQAKRGLRTTNAKNNTWTIQPADQIEINSELERMSEEARKYLQRVVEQHAGTPWAYLAQLELDTPRGWQWHDSYTPTPEEGQAERRENRRRAPRDQQTRSIPRKPKRDIPRL